MEEIKSETRVRMNATVDAKGFYKPDVTAESPTVEQSRELWAAAHKALIEEIEKAGGIIVRPVG